MITPETHGELSRLNWSTLSDERAANVTVGAIRRASIVMTNRCNFACPYCKTLSEDRAPARDRDETFALVRSFAAQGLRELRLSGGEPTMVSWLPELVSHARDLGVRVAVSTNGYSPARIYEALVDAGVAEFSISLDSTDPAEADRLAGGRPNVLSRVLSNIETIVAKGASVYIGMTCCASRITSGEMRDLVEKVAALGVTDVKVMTVAQEGGVVDASWLDDDLARRFPFLAWRLENFRAGRDVRGLRETDSHKCPLVLDDVTVSGDLHYPCNVYFREGGDPIGNVRDPDAVPADRAKWHGCHDTHADPICSAMCMDLLRTYNNRVAALEKSR